MTLCKLRGSHLTIQRKRLPGAPPASWPGTFPPFLPPPTPQAGFLYHGFRPQEEGFLLAARDIGRGERLRWVFQTQVSREHLTPQLIWGLKHLTWTWTAPRYSPRQLFYAFLSEEYASLRKGSGPHHLLFQENPGDDLEENQARGRFSRERCKTPQDQKNQHLQLQGNVASLEYFRLVFLVLKGGTDRGRVNPFLTLTQECWRVNTEERKEPLVSPGRRFAPGLPRPCFSTAVKNDDFITAGTERKAGLLRS